MKKKLVKSNIHFHEKNKKIYNWKNGKKTREIKYSFSRKKQKNFYIFCPILEDCAIFWREETSNFSGDDYDDTQIEDDVFIVFSLVKS